MKLTVHLDIDAIKARVLERRAREAELRARGVAIFRDWVSKVKGKRTMKLGCLVIAALLLSGCGSKLPTAPTVDLPKAGQPARLELAVVPGTGDHGGTAAVTVRVLDPFSAALPDRTVTFIATAGTLTPTEAVTDEKGIARTSITAPAGSVTITATLADITTKTLAAIEPLVGPPAAPNPPQPGPDVPPVGVPPFVPKIGSYIVTMFASPSPVIVGGTATISANAERFDDAPPPSAFAWDCGNGTTTTTTTAASITCLYPTVGTFLAKVTVTGGTAKGVGATTVTVALPPPPVPPALTVTLAGNATSVAKGGTLIFSATVGNLNGDTIVAFQWDLDDTSGFEYTTLTSPRTSAVYATAGLFTATVKVTTLTGRTASATFQYVVTSL